MSKTVNPAGPTPAGPATDLKRTFRDARRDPQLAVLEGLHALKHALRFGAEMLHTAVVSPARLGELADALAPDIRERILADAVTVPAEVFTTLAPLAPATGVIAIARRPAVDARQMLTDARPEPVVLLENTSDLGNIGACVRVAAAADITGVLTTGIHDPWDPAALRGSAGLHFAVAVAHLGEDALAWVSPGGDDELAGSRPLIALDPGGRPLCPGLLPQRAILAFGAERQGLSRELLERADARVCLPMRAGVSSLNLATSVAAVLYSWRLAGGEPSAPID